MKNIAKILLYVIGFNPVASVLIAIGLKKFKMYVVAKMALLGARLGRFWGPAVTLILSGLFAVSGLTIGADIAKAVYDCIMQRKKGINFTFKRTRKGIPYAIDIYAK